MVQYQQLTKFDLKARKWQRIVSPQQCRLVVTTENPPSSHFWTHTLASALGTSERPPAMPLQDRLLPARLPRFVCPGWISCWQLLIRLLADLLSNARLRARSHGRPGKIPLLNLHLRQSSIPWAEPLRAGEWHLPSSPGRTAPVPVWATWALGSVLPFQTPFLCLWLGLQLPVLWRHLTVFRFQPRAQILWPAPDPAFLICLENRFCFVFIA